MLISEREAWRRLTISGSGSLLPASRLLIHGASPAGAGGEHRLRKFTFQFEAGMRGQVSGTGFGAQGQGHSADPSAVRLQDAPRRVTKAPAGGSPRLCPQQAEAPRGGGRVNQLRFASLRDGHAALGRRRGHPSRNCQGKMPAMQHQFLKSKRTKAKYRLL